MITRQRFCIVVFLAGAMTVAGPTLAGVITIPSFDRGSVRSDGGHTATNDNYLVKGYGAGTIPLERRNFFVFDLSGLTEEASAAVFRVYNPPDGFKSPNTYETLQLNRIDKVPVRNFFADDPGVDAFFDLGNGTIPYGSIDIQQTDLDVFIDIPLSAAALWDLNFTINNNLTYFGFGGSLTTLDLSDLVEESVFASSGSIGGPGDGNSVLILSGAKIPEPTTFVMWSLLGVIGLLVARSRRRTA